MSASAPLIQFETPAYFQAPNFDSASKEAIRDLVHELRQPLSSIEAIAYFLEMTLPADQFQARQYMRRVQQLVNDAESILEGTVSSTVRKPPASAVSAGTA